MGRDVNVPGVVWERSRNATRTLLNNGSTRAVSRPGRFAIRQALQGLEHHHRRRHVAGDRGPTSVRGEQVGEQVIGKQLLADISQERFDASLRDKLPAQRRRVEELPVRVTSALHPPILEHPPSNREHFERIVQQCPSPDAPSRPGRALYGRRPWQQSPIIPKAILRGQNIAQRT